jgi:hypothetical protein
MVVSVIIVIKAHLRMNMSYALWRVEVYNYNI